MDLDYNKLKSFLAVVRCGGVTAAARELHRTQSAVSQALRTLEEHLGLKLIEWEGKRLKLTRDGELIYRAASDRMAAVEEQLSLVVQGEEVVAGFIEVGVLQDHSTAIQERLIQLISSFRAAYPAVSFKVHLGTSWEIERVLLARTLDIGLLINFSERHRFRVFEVASEEHLVVASSHYLQQKGPFTLIEELIGADLIDIDEGFTCLTAWVRKHEPLLVTKLHRRLPSVCVPDFRLIRALVLQGQGVAVLPRYLIEEDVRRGDILALFPHLASLRVGLDCAMEKGRRERLCERLFLESWRENSSTCVFDEEGGSSRRYLSSTRRDR